MASIRKTLIIVNVFGLIGCTGPKFMSNSSGSQEALKPIPKHQKVIVSPFNDYATTEKVDYQTIGAYFAKVLANKLLRTGLFTLVTLSSAKPDSTGIVISGSVSSLGKRSWGSRAMLGNTENSFEVTGEIRDQDNNTLLRFTKSRSAQGGLIGAGGWFTAGSGQMTKQLADWVADDVLKVIKKAIK